MKTEDVTEQMKSPIWRICNIYKIKNKVGATVPFRPTKQQKRVLREIFIRRRKKLFIPKARQLGMSTLIAIIILDSVLFGNGVRCSICDFVSGNAKKKLEDKIIFAFNQLPLELRDGWTVDAHDRNKGEWRIRKTNGDDDSACVVFAGDKPRGDTYQILHLSELGETQVKHPDRAREIFEGSLPTAEQSIIIIETTWHGGRVGVLYALVDEAMTTPDELKDPDKDYFILFFPWWEDETYTSKGDPSQITEQTREYFKGLSSNPKCSGHVFTEGQMLWYQKMRTRMQNRIYSAYPSLLEEIFLSPVDGAVYAREIDEAKVAGRVGGKLYDPSLPVHTLWDFGAPTNTICLYFQMKDGKFWFIDADVIETKSKSGTEINGLDIDFPRRMRHMMAKGYTYGTHYIPHDGASRDIKYRVSWQDDMMNNGLQGKVVVIPRTNDLWLGINRAKADFPLYYWSDAMTPYLDGLAMYRRREDPKNPKKFTDEVIHDFASHLADPLRVLAEGCLGGYISPTSVMHTNLALDPDMLLTSSSKAKTPQVGFMEPRGKREIFTKDDAGWANVWESVDENCRYLCVINRGAAQVWRAESKTRDEHRASLVASLKIDGRYDQDLLVQRGCQIARHYGCIVIPVINNNEAIVRRVLESGCPIFARRVPDSNRPMGRHQPPKKPGLDLTDSLRESCVDTLISMWREDKLVVHDPQWHRSANAFIRNDNGDRVALHGYDDAQVIASAIAVHHMQYAGEPSFAQSFGLIGVG